MSVNRDKQLKPNSKRLDDFEVLSFSGEVKDLGDF